MEIKDLTNKKGKFTKAEIAFVIAEGKKYGIDPPEKTGCPDCWHDMALQVALAMKGERKVGMRLRGDAAKHGVIFKGRTITNATLDAETFEWMMANNFPKQLLEDAED